MEKTKNKRLLARVCSLIGVIMLLCCMALPAFAADAETLAIIPFDTLTFYPADGSAQTIFPWPLNSATPSQFDDPSRITVGNLYFTYELYQQPHVLSSAIDPNWSMSGEISLHRRDLYVPLVFLRDDNYLLGFTGDDDAFGTVTVDGYIMTYSVVEGEHFLSGEYFHYSETSDYFDLCDILYDAVSSSKAAGDAMVYIHDLEVMFSDMSGVDALHFDFSTTDYMNSGLTWASSLRLPHTTTTTVVGSDGFSFSWLVNAVSGFLEVELWDGFTLSGVLSLAFIIGLLFLFLKMAI